MFKLLLAMIIMGLVNIETWNPLRVYDLLLYVIYFYS